MSPYAIKTNNFTNDLPNVYIFWISLFMQVSLSGYIQYFICYSRNINIYNGFASVWSTEDIIIK